MKSSYNIPRHAHIVFLWCSIFAALISLGSIMAFMVLMPENDHGRQAILTACRAFGPGFLASVLIASISYRALRLRRKKIEAE
jgi:hypothetical protein